MSSDEETDLSETDSVSDHEDIIQEPDQEALCKDLVSVCAQQGIQWNAITAMAGIFMKHCLGKQIVQALPKSAFGIKSKAKVGRTVPLVRLCPHDCPLNASFPPCSKCAALPAIMKPGGARRMLLTDIASRLRALYEIPAMAQAMEYAFTRTTTGDGDVWDGDHFINITGGTCFIHRIYNDISF